MNIYLFVACLRGRYGPNCQYYCNCDNGGSCDPLTGSCRCLLGWIGPQCKAIGSKYARIGK